LQAYWRDGNLVLENYVTRTAVSAAPITIQILDFFGEWRRRDALAAAMPEFDRASVARAVRDLVSHSCLVAEGSAAARTDAHVAETWKHWLPHGSFHFATKDAPFASPRQWARMAREFIREGEQPPLVKSYPDRPRIVLPAPEPPPGDFLEVLRARKTHREFSGRTLPLGALANLLHYTWGTTGVLDTPNFGPLLHRSSPSGGARHPAEAYVAVLDVEGVAPGLYHYDHVAHALARLRRGPMRKAVLRQTLGQAHVGNANAVVFMTAVFPRSMFKYRSPRAYRIVSLETGHLAQTFCLVATWLGLAPFTTAALADSAIERAIGIDGVEESVLYVAGVGMPKGVRARGRGAAPRPSVARASTRRP
jgi:SagB-type dehydrogenase family enzyme